jgi:hypothetical protein
MIRTLKFAAIAFMLCHAGARLFAYPQKSARVPIVDSYSSWREAKPDDAGFSARVPSEPKYSKTYNDGSVSHIFIGTLNERKEIKYVLIYRSSDSEITFNPTEFITHGALSEFPDKRILRTTEVTLNGRKGVEVIALLNDGPRRRNYRILSFIAGADAYLVSFSGSKQEDLFGDDVEYFLKHFVMTPRISAKGGLNERL